MIDPIITSYDNQLALLNSRLNLLKDRIASTKNTKIPLVKEVIRGLGAGYADVVVYNYNALQDWNNKWLDTHPAPAYISSSSNQPQPAEASKWNGELLNANNLIATDTAELPQVEAEKSDLITKRTAYINNLPTIIADSIKADDAANIQNANAAAYTAAAAAAKAEAEGKVSSIEATTQATTKYLIFGAIALTVLIIGVVVAHKYFKS